MKSWKKQLEEKIAKGKKFSDELNALGIRTEFDPKTGEITTTLGEFKRAEEQQAKED